LGRVIGVVSGKGGVGKTTVVINVGAALAGTFHKRVAVVDCNVTTSHLGVSLGMSFLPKTLNHVMRGEASLHEATYPHNSGMSVVPSSMKLADLKGIDFSTLKPIVRSLAEQNDLVILDSGPGLGREAVGALAASQELLFIAQPTLPSVMDIVRTQEAVKNASKTHIGLVLNLVEDHGHHLQKQAVENLAGMSVISVVPRDDHVPKSLAAQMPVVMQHPEAPSSRQFFALAAHLLGIQTAKEPTLKEKMTGRFAGVTSAFNGAFGLE
jgi:septum site-determining protein MinD